MAVGTGAAFFDLDRTILKGASGPLITRALVSAGVLPDRRLPGAALLYRVYEWTGETLAAIGLARRVSRVFAGLDPDAVRAAAPRAAELLAQRVLPYVPPLIDDHHRAGRMVVMTTTTPYDLVEPLAHRLGFDGVVATTYAQTEGRYTGELEGNFVWFFGKLAAVRDWAAGREISMDECWAYSDSVYDVPLLAAVGHPHAVNPDPRLRVLATARRWPILWLDVPPGVPKLLGLEPFDVLRAVARPQLFPFARFDIRGTSRIPREGPGIVVSNHRSYFDTVALAITLAKAGRTARFLGKKEVFDAPLIGIVARSLGGIRVDREAHSTGPLREAERAIAAGELVILMPQGTIPRGPDFFDPHLVGRPGAARLAHTTRAPVIPVGLWGTEGVWPRNARLPNMLTLTRPPRVRVRVGSEVPMSYRSVRADTERIMKAIERLLPPEAIRGKEPTENELKRAYPPGRGC